MAHKEDARRKVTVVEERQQQYRLELIEAHGDILGNAIYKYLSNQERSKEGLAEAIAKTLEGPFDKKVEGVIALLDAVEEKTHREIKRRTTTPIY